MIIHKEFPRLQAHNLRETNSQKVAGYVNGLKLSIQDQMYSNDIFTMVNAHTMANKIETQFERQSAMPRKASSSAQKDNIANIEETMIPQL